MPGLRGGTVMTMATDDLQGLLGAFNANPADKDLWLVMADLHEERGEEKLSRAWREMRDKEYWPSQCNITLSNHIIPYSNYWIQTAVGEGSNVWVSKETGRRLKGDQVGTYWWRYPSPQEALLDLVQALAT